MGTIDQRSRPPRLALKIRCTPDGHEVLSAGDILALTGTHEAIDAAEALLGARTGPGMTASS